MRVTFLSAQLRTFKLRVYEVAPLKRQTTSEQLLNLLKCVRGSFSFSKGKVNIYSKKKP